MHDFVEIVNAELERQEMSISELARRADISRPYVHRILSREQMPSLELAEKVLAALGFRVVFEKHPV